MTDTAHPASRNTWRLLLRCLVLPQFDHLVCCLVLVLGLQLPRRSKAWADITDLENDAGTPVWPSAVCHASCQTTFGVDVATQCESSLGDAMTAHTPECVPPELSAFRSVLKVADCIPGEIGDTCILPPVLSTLGLPPLDGDVDEGMEFHFTPDTAPRLARPV